MRKNKEQLLYKSTINAAPYNLPGETGTGRRGPASRGRQMTLNSVLDPRFVSQMGPYDVAGTSPHHAHHRLRFRPSFLESNDIR